MLLAFGLILTVSGLVVVLGPHGVFSAAPLSALHRPEFAGLLLIAAGAWMRRRSRHRDERMPRR